MNVTVLIISERRKAPTEKMPYQGKLYAHVVQNGQLGKNLLSGRQVTSVESAKTICRNRLCPVNVSDWDIQL